MDALSIFIPLPLLTLSTFTWTQANHYFFPLFSSASGFWCCGFFCAALRRCFSHWIPLSLAHTHLFTPREISFSLTCFSFPSFFFEKLVTPRVSIFFYVYSLISRIICFCIFFWGRVDMKSSMKRGNKMRVSKIFMFGNTIDIKSWEEIVSFSDGKTQIHVNKRKQFLM